MIDKCFIKVADFMNRHYRLMLALILLTYFSHNLMGGLVKGGRWDLYQNIAMADRFLTGQGFYYSTIEASSPYFPGVAFLSVIVGKFFNPYRDYILLVVASVIGTAFLYLLIKLGERFSKNKALSLIVTFLLIIIGFRSYQSYMNEFKADTLVLLLAAFIINAIDRIERGKCQANFRNAVTVFLLGFLMDITKQQALYVDIALGLYLLFTSNLTAKNKLMLLGSLVLGGLASLAVIFSIPGIEIQTIKNLSAMPYWGLKDIIIQMGSCFLHNAFYFIALFLFIYLYIQKRVNLDFFANKWLLLALFFGIGQIVGGWKTGGNDGNYEVGMVTFLPFTIMAADYFIHEFIIPEKTSTIIAFLNYTVLTACFAIVLFCGYRIPKFSAKIREDNAVSSYLSTKLGHEEILYYSNQYMQLARSTVRPGMDIYSTPGSMDEHRHDREIAFKNKTYKHLYVDVETVKIWDKSALTYFGDKLEAYKALVENYTEIQDPDMPESLKGQLFIAKD